MDPERNIPEALRRLRSSPEIDVAAVSSVYATRSVGRDGAPDGNPDFHNAAILIRTAIGPLALRAILREIESELGRRRTSDTYAPRPIDLDIVFYDSVVIRTEAVAIPDLGALELPHVAVPLADVAPDWRPPGRAITAARAAQGHELEIVG